MITAKVLKTSASKPLDVRVLDAEQLGFVSGSVCRPPSMLEGPVSAKVPVRCASS
jgi:hypothetical protein